MFARSTLVALALMSVATVANAATLTNVSGAVSVNSGQGFRPVGSGYVVQPGDRVSVAPGGRATIVCGPESIIPIAGGSTITVACPLPGAQASGSQLPGTAPLAPEVVGGALIVGGAAAIGIAAAVSGGSGGITIIPPVSP